MLFASEEKLFHNPGSSPGDGKYYVDFHLPLFVGNHSRSCILRIVQISQAARQKAIPEKLLVFSSLYEKLNLFKSPFIKPKVVIQGHSDIAPDKVCFESMAGELTIIDRKINIRQL